MKLAVPYQVNFPNYVHKRGSCRHEPKFRFWQMFAVRRCYWNGESRYDGFNLWIYTRWGTYCFYVSWPKVQT